MLDDKVCLHSELGAFLDGERFRLEGFNRAGSGQVDSEVRAAFDFEGERFDHAAALVLWVDRDGGGGGYA